MTSDNTQESDGDKFEPFETETRIRILDIKERRPIGHEIQCISEPSLYILRSRLGSSDALSVGETLELPSENLGSFSELRLKDLSGSSQQELISAISASFSALFFSTRSAAAFLAASNSAAASCALRAASALDRPSAG